MELRLPYTIASYSDCLKVLRALDLRESVFINAQAASVAAKPNPDKLLQDLADMNKIDLMSREACSKLKTFLEKNIDRLPQIHISFAVEPSAEVTQTLLAWLRTNIHPGVLITIGLQPSIAAGCVLRTPNKIFDFSLRAFVKQQDAYLSQLIRGAVSGN